MWKTYTGKFESNVYPNAFSSGTLSIALLPLAHVEPYATQGSIVYTGAYRQGQTAHFVVNVKPNCTNLVCDFDSPLMQGQLVLNVEHRTDSALSGAWSLTQPVDRGTFVASVAPAGMSCQIQ